MKKKIGAIWMIVAAGAALRLIQYAYNRSIWLDEACLALNILERDYYGLLQPLEAGQVAPILFLWLEKAMTLLLGNNEWALKVIPLLSSLAALVLIHPLARRLTGSATAAWMTLVLFALSPMLLRYTTEVKQYSTDVLIAVLLPAIATDSLPALRRHRYGWLMLAGALSVGLSNIAVLVLFSTGLYELLTRWRTRNWSHLASFIGAYAVLVAVFAGYYALFIRHHPTRDFMVGYWQFAFLPLPLWSVESWRWMAENWGYYLFKVCCYDFQGIRPLRFLPGWYGLAWALGFWVAFSRRQYGLLFFAAFPPMLHWTLSAAQLYPFYPTVALYLSVGMLMAIGAGLGYASDRVGERWGKRAHLALLGFALLWPIGQLALNFPLQFEEIRPALRYIEARKSPVQRLMVYPKAQPPVDFYARTGGISADLQESLIPFDTILPPGEHWVLLAHLTPAAQRQLRRALARNSAQPVDSLLLKGASAYLFR